MRLAKKVCGYNRKSPYKIKYKQFDIYGTVTKQSFETYMEYKKQLYKLKKRKDIVWIKTNEKVGA